MKQVNTVQYILQRWHRSSSHPHVGNVIHQLKTCRTASQGYHLYQCSNENCGRYHYRYHSCRNRHCPQCGSFQKQQWIEDRTGELLPTHYFHVVFTLPHSLNSIVAGNRKQLLKLLFDASSRTLLRFAKDSRYLGATPGILSVLHTWGQQLSFHPHVHCIVSSGGLVETGINTQWKNSIRNSRNFLFPVKALSAVFRAKFLQGLKQLAKRKEIIVTDEMGFHSLLNKLWQWPWMVYAKKPFGGPQQVIAYLGRYTHKTAITNHRIKQVDEQLQTVSFLYRDYADSNTEKLMTLPVQEFIRRFEQHILPKGFTRIRSYGYLCNRGRADRMKRIIKTMNIPSHPPKIKTPWQLRLLLQYGIQNLRCIHCGCVSLQIVKVCFSFMPVNDS